MAETVLTLGNTREALTVVRSLGRAGYRVVAGRIQDPDATEFSRYVAASWRHPPLLPDASAFLAAFAELCRRVTIDWVLPIGETPIRVLARDPLPLARERLVMVNADTAMTCFDKERMYEIARRLGIDVPATERVVRREQLVAAARRCGYPCVLKTNDSTSRLLEEKALICADEAALTRIADELFGAETSVLVQSFAAGHRVNCEFAAWDGALHSYFEHAVQRTDRPNGTGYIVETVSIPPTPVLRRHTEALARHFRYTGVGTAQYLVDPAKGAAAFLELNPRLDAACSLSFHSGCDFPLRALEIAQRRAGAREDLPEARVAYRLGMRCNWLHGDLRALRRARRSPSDAAPPTLVWLGRAARSFLRADCHATWWWRDRGPVLFLYPGLRGRRAPPVAADA